jgi:branched-chain amino acid transport system permease protein
MTVATQAATDPARTSEQRAREVARELKLFRSWPARIAAGLFVVAIVAVPLDISSTFVLSLGATSAIYAVGAIGLNLLIGYAGQVSVGHSFFVSVGAFTAAALGGSWGLPMPVWLLGSVLVGGLVGGAIGPVALRLRGIYQIVLTLGLVYVGTYVFTNWKSLTGGNQGTTAALSLKLGPIDFAALRLGGTTYSTAQGLFILTWLVVGVCVLLTHNVVRSRAGRAMMAVRDGELAAEVVGSPPVLVKVSAFAMSGALAALCGSLLVAQLQYVNAKQFTLAMSIQFIVMVIVGGAGTAWGPVVGALLISSIPQFINEYSANIPLLKSDFDTGGGFGLRSGEFSLILYGALLVLFVLLEPRGLIHLVGRLARRAGRVTRPTSRTRHQDNSVN